MDDLDVIMDHFYSEMLRLLDEVTPEIEIKIPHHSRKPWYYSYIHDQHKIM